MAMLHDAITLTSPITRQVVQRDLKNEAALLIEGRISVEAATVEARADLDPEATRGESVGWTVVASGDQIRDGCFSGRLRLRAGGWYTIFIRAKQKEAVVAEARVEMVGVGDVYITAGQSNSANGGDVRQNAADSRVIYFDGTSFVPARDPIPGAVGEGGTPWPILGDILVRTTQAPVCFRSATIWWAPVRDWLPNAVQKEYPYYKTLVERVKQFGPGGVRAVLWHQGEDDNRDKTPSEDYARDLGIVIEFMRKEVGYRVDWFVASAVSYSLSRGSSLETARGQKLVSARGIAFPGPDTDDLGPKYRRADDGGHFNQLGLQTHAERWFAALCREYNFSNPVSAKLI